MTRSPATGTGRSVTADAPGRRRRLRTAREIALQTTLRASSGALLSRELGRALDRSHVSPRDRSLITDLVYGAVRWRIWLDAALAPRLRNPDGLPGDVVDALRLGSFEKLIRGTPPHAAVDAWVGIVGRRHPRLAGLANAVLRRVEPPVDPSPATRASLPTWLWERLASALGDDAERAADAMRTPSPLWLVAFAAEARASLEDDGCEVASGPVEGTLRVRPSRRLGDLEAFREGLVQPQNPASHIVAEMLGAGRGDRVLDLCSGRGVKAAGLAARGAAVEAIELSASKVDQARRNLARLGLEVDHRVADLREPPAGVQPAPYVLLDAPCSGTGTLRGHPEIPLRLGPGDVDALAASQDRLLDTAAALTDSGGVLVYAVCALTPEEGPGRIDAFLSRHPAFDPEAVDPPVQARPAGAGTFILPLDGLDGFFVARLRRREVVS
ncbi:MAG: transcription antitermination factor NusB [Trueperaceae bacterium]|nr:transcription antitermination factor NusB [Trueperaceae bacterium]